MKRLKIILMGLLSVCLMNGCTKDIQVTQTEEVAKVEQVEELQKSEVVEINDEMKRQKLEILMMESREGNVSIEESPDGTYLCGIDYETNHLVILDEEGKEVLNSKLVSPSDESLQLTFYAWAEEKDWLWLIHNRTHQVKDFVKIDLKTGEVTYFEQNYGFNGDYALEPNTGYLCFSNAPVILDVEEREEFIASNQEITLKLVNLFEEGKEKIIVTANSRIFNPQWIQPYFFTYNDPLLGADEIERVTYAFNQSYKLLPTITDPVEYETDEMYMNKYAYIVEELKALGEKSDAVVTLYGYTIPIKDINIRQENGEPLSEQGYIDCIPDNVYMRLHLYINDTNAEECTVLANFFKLKYDDETVAWLMNKFVNERESYIAFTDGSFIRFGMTTAGFKSVSVGVE